ncbi:MAG: hypothetical protein H6975_01495 [Gammaproteobacteria bacterium]|nr:hypothetical protein [Gammaproteobacteria bacterium]
MSGPIPFKTQPLYEEGLEIHSLALHATEHLAALRALAGSTTHALNGEEWMFLMLESCG